MAPIWQNFVEKDAKVPCSSLAVTFSGLVPNHSPHSIITLTAQMYLFSQFSGLNEFSIVTITNPRNIVALNNME